MKTKGPQTYRRLVPRKASPLSAEQMMKKLEQQAFVALSEENSAAYGWVSPEDPLDCRVPRHLTFTGDLVTLRLRYDKWALPSARVKAETKKQMNEALASTGKEKLSKAEKDQIKEDVVIRFRRASTPAMKAVDVVVDSSSTVWVFSSSTAIVEAAQLLVEDALDIELLPADLLVRAQEQGADTTAYYEGL